MLQKYIVLLHAMVTKRLRCFASALYSVFWNASGLPITASLQNHWLPHNLLSAACTVHRKC